ncbi:MAG: 7TM diverse intracellular signaling domain-containing protein, partial [Nitrososphaeraceae archaeon]|nr:7TM diverse intracellular signaling domain-containing protein [Nitrososphaeraceae archaeon]
MRSLLLFLGLIIPFCLNGQYVYNINDEADQHIFVYEFIEFLEDPIDSMSFQRVSSGAYDELFVPSKEFTPDNYNISSTYWYKIKIKHNSNSEKKWLLEFFDQTIDSIFAYLPDSNGFYSKLILGESKSFQSRRIKHKNFVIPIENDHDEELTYYFKVKASHPVDIILVVRSFDFFSFYSLNEYFLFGLFYGLIILIALYNLLLFFSLRELPYLYFVLFAAGIMLYFSSMDGFAYQYVWPNFPDWNKYAYGVFAYSLVVFGILFSKEFLHLKFKSKKADRLLNLVLFLRTLFFIYCLLFNHILFDYFVIEIIPLIIILFIGVRLFIRG